MRTAIKTAVSALKRPPGRPSKFQNDIEQVVDEYLSKECVDVFNPRTRRFNVSLPSVEGLALYLRMSRDTLYTLAKKHESYQRALEHVKSQQQMRLINQGLAGNYNPSIASLMLRVNHGMSEQRAHSDKNRYIGVLKAIYEQADALDSQVAI